MYIIFLLVVKKLLKTTVVIASMSGYNLDDFDDSFYGLFLYYHGLLLFVGKLFLYTNIPYLVTVYRSLFTI